MAKFESAFFDLSYLDTLASGKTPLHRLDPRIKVLTTALFIVCVVSFDKYAIAAMLPFAVFLTVIMELGGVPPTYLINKLLITSPFAIMVGIFNPFFDQQIMLQLGPIGVSGGWLSFFSILLRFSLTVSATLILIATTGFNSVCMALERLGIPKIFAVQLLLLYRYIFVLIAEGQRMYQARALRSFQRRRMDIKTILSANCSCAPLIAASASILPCSVEVLTAQSVPARTSATPRTTYSFFSSAPYC